MWALFKADICVSSGETAAQTSPPPAMAFSQGSGLNQLTSSLLSFIPAPHVVRAKSVCPSVPLILTLEIASSFCLSVGSVMNKHIHAIFFITCFVHVGRNPNLESYTLIWDQSIPNSYSPFFNSSTGRFKTITMLTNFESLHHPTSFCPMRLHNYTYANFSSASCKSFTCCFHVF